MTLLKNPKKDWPKKGILLKIPFFLRIIKKDHWLKFGC
jgi:hypothetical protein